MRIDFALERGTGTEPLRICDAVAGQEPGITHVLEACADHPALSRSVVTRTIARSRRATVRR